jgi:hypothetical protein
MGRSENITLGENNTHVTKRFRKWEGGGGRKGGRTPQLAYHKDYVLQLRQQKEVLMQVVK